VPFFRKRAAGGRPPVTNGMAGAVRALNIDGSTASIKVGLRHAKTKLNG